MSLESRSLSVHTDPQKQAHGPEGGTDCPPRQQTRSAVQIPAVQHGDRSRWRTYDSDWVRDERSPAVVGLALTRSMLFAWSSDSVRRTLVTRSLPAFGFNGRTWSRLPDELVRFTAERLSLARSWGRAPPPGDRRPLFRSASVEAALGVPNDDELARETLTEACGCRIETTAPG